jgi:hypothetical protein
MASEAVHGRHRLRLAGPSFRRPTAAVLLGGRIRTSNVDRAVKEMAAMLAALRDVCEPEVFVSLNEAVHDAHYLEVFCAELGIDPVRQTAVSPTAAPPELHHAPRRPETDVGRCWSMFEHNLRAFELMRAEEARRGAAFDVVIKYRADIHQTAPAQYARLAHAVSAAAARGDDGRVWVPHGQDWCGGLNDQVALGGPLAMAEYCACVRAIGGMCRAGVLYHPETLLANHLRICGLEVVRFEFAYALWR